MADTKISAFTDGVTAIGTDDIAAARAGANVRITPAYIRTFLLALANTWLANGAASTPPMLLSGTWFTGGSATTTKPQFLVEPTGTTSTGWSTAGTGFGVNAPSGFAGNLVDLKINGLSALSVTSAGVVRPQFHTGSGGLGYASGPGGPTLLDDNGVTCLVISRNLPGPVVPSNIGFYMGDSADVGLFRDAANVFAMRAGTNAQAFRVYGTFTDASNYERGALNAGADYIELAAETAGTGDDDMDVRLTPAGTGRVRLGTHAAIGIKTVTGYIEIKDSAGTVRNIAVVS